MHKLVSRSLIASVLIAGTSVLAQNAVVQGDVKGVDGRPAKSAEVRVTPQGKGGAASVAKTDAQGRFAIKNLAAGNYTVQAMAGGGMSSQSQAVKVADRPVALSLTLRAAAGPGVKTVVKNGKKKKYVWVPSETGSNLGGRYVEVDDENATDTSTIGNVQKGSGATVRKIQTQGNDRPSGM